MYLGKKILGLIPARGGSISVPRKNLYPLNGKPLILYTTESAGQSEFLDAVYCSTNDDEIASVAFSQGGCGIIPRPDELSTDTAKTIDCVIHALTFLSEKGEDFDYVMILQPTSPLRKTEQIDGCIRYVIDNNILGCVSVSKIPYLPVLMRHMNTDGYLSPIISGCGTVRRQDVLPTYYVDGCLYMWSVPEIIRKGSDLSLNDAQVGYEIDSDSGFDFNEISDIARGERLLNRK